MNIEIIKLGLMPYDQVLHLQKKIHQEVQDGIRPDTLLLVEHPHVFTMGRRTDMNHLLKSREYLGEAGIGLFSIDRGGDITYHGPGQVVGYPIINLKRIKKKTKSYVDGVEETFIRLLESEFGIEAEKGLGKYTGIWVANKKITAIGVEIKHFVTMHGFAFNVNTILDYFNWIVPCGLGDRGVTSLKSLTGSTHNMDTMFDMVGDYFCQVFNLSPRVVTLKDVEGHT